MKINVYAVISERIEQGVRHGLRRSFKYDERPTHDHIIDTITNEVLGALSDVIVWEDDDIVTKIDE